MTGFPISPPRDRLVDDRGFVAPSWYRFFVQIQKLIGGPSNPFEDTAFLHSIPPQQRQQEDGLSIAPPSLPQQEKMRDDLTPYFNPLALCVIRDVGANWAAATGTEARTALASYAGQTVSNPPTQAEMQALDNAVKTLSQAVVALINDLRTNDTLA